MAKYRKKPVVIEATRWFKNGDHPQDYAENRQGFENGEMREWTASEVRARIYLANTADWVHDGGER